MKYRREIDGLRSVAVLPVILFHAGFKLFRGGFVGVDIFFVISGYLITTIIVDELERGSFSIVNFYERRARRILPALFFVMFCCLPFAWRWLLPTDLRDFSQGLIAVPAFVSNVLFYLTGGMFGYFGDQSELQPLLHTWSLAVEEQYYVLFPPLLMLVWRFGKRWVVGLLMVLLTASLIAAQVGSTAFENFSFFMLPTRAWELLIGALTAFYLRRNYDPARSVRQWGSALGLLLIGIAVFTFDRKTPFPGVYGLVPTLGTALIILFASDRTFVGKLLGSRPLVAIGLISYSAYLWHQPLFAFARLQSIYRPGHALFGWLALLALMLAYFSWRFVEMPFRSRHVFTRRQIFVSGATCSVLCIALGTAIYLSAGFPNRFHNEFLDRRAPLLDLPTVDNGWCFYSVDTIRRLAVGEQGLSCSVGEQNSPALKALLIGDSFAGQYEPFWDVLGKRMHIKVDAVTTNWCFPSLTDGFTGPLTSPAYDQCLLNRKYFRANASKYDFIILGAAWQSVMKLDHEQEVLDVVDWAAQNAGLVVVMASPFSFDYSPLIGYQRAGYRHLDFDINKIGRKRDPDTVRANLRLEMLAKNYPNVFFVGREALFSVDGKLSYLTAEGVPFNWDNGHLSIYGAQAAAAIFAESPTYGKFAARVSALQRREASAAPSPHRLE